MHFLGVKKSKKKGLKRPKPGAPPPGIFEEGGRIIGRVKKTPDAKKTPDKKKVEKAEKTGKIENTISHVSTTQLEKYCGESDSGNFIFNVNALIQKIKQKSRH